MVLSKVKQHSDKYNPNITLRAVKKKIKKSHLFEYLSSHLPYTVYKL